MASCLPGQLCAATVIVNNLNAGTGEGFDDPTTVSAVAGNPATTLGAQRLAAFQAAADDWGATLVSPITIIIDAQMTSLYCVQNSAVLGSAGPNGYIFRDFPEAPAPATWFPQALYNSLAAEDGDPRGADVAASFNQDIGQPGCLQSLDWSYVIGADAPPGTIPFTETVLHEIGHGLGFLTFVDNSTGELLNGYSDQYTRFLLDETPTPTLWTDLTALERAASAIDNGELTWAGPEVTNVAGFLSSGRHPSGRVRMYAPGSLRPGSSVSHFDTVLSPNELMEPSASSNISQRLTNHLMLDIGWRTQVGLAVTKTDDQSSVTAGSATSYTMTITNNGPSDITVVDASVIDTMPAALIDASWTCSGSGGATCASPGGSGSINSSVTVPFGGAVTYVVSATIDSGFSGNLSNTITVGMPGNINNTLSSSATDLTTVEPAISAGISVSDISGNTTEAGGTANFSIVLNGAPADDVIIGISSNDTSEGILGQPGVTFTPDNWEIPQQVTVTGVDDDVQDGDVAYSIITAAAASNDGNYANLDPADISVTNQDDDNAGISVSAISGSTTEAGGTATFTVVLDSEPTHDVTIEIISDNTDEGTPDPSSLTFTPGNWSSPQLVTVSGVDDGVVDGAVDYSIITAPAVSTDSNYSGMDAADVTVTNEDDDIPEVIFEDSFE